MATFGKAVRTGDCEESSPQTTRRSPEDRERCIHDDLKNRLKNICQNMPAAKFEELILSMTHEQLRSERAH